MKKSDINVLIVEDDKSAGIVFSEAIKRLGFKTHHVTRAEDALQFVKIKTVHLAVVDVLLPKTSGVDLAMEFRASRFGNTPIIFMSGIFKDKSFAQEAVRKAAAVEFLFKPFGTEELTQAVSRALEPLLSIEQWTVGSLLTSRLNSPREKLKAIERLGTIEGFQLPVVLSTLLDSQTSGHLNIVTSQEEIYGATVVQGSIIAGDSKDFHPTTLELLVQKGFVTQDDVNNAAKSKNDNVEHFLEQGLVSPHAVSEVKLEQIYHLLDQVCVKSGLQLSYVPSDVELDRVDIGVDLSAILIHMNTYPDIFFPEESLKDFYQPVITAPVRALTKSFELLDDEIHLMVTKNLTLEEVIKVSDKPLSEILRNVHSAFIGKQIAFDDLAKVKSLDTLVERFERLYTEFKIRQPHEIFEYFGADSQFKVEDVARIYKEYVEANHPDKLPKGASAELRRLCQDCFNIIQEAYDALSTEEGRDEYEKGLRAQKGERLAYVHTLTEEGVEQLRRGQAQSALAMFREANKILLSSRVTMLCIWADIKVQGQQIDRELVNKYLQQLDNMTPDEKKTPLYFMTMGLSRRALGDTRGAIGFFERALQIDGTFAEARREINSINTQSNSSKKFDLLNGDITDVVSQIFRRRKD